MTRILIVDDSRTSRKILKNILTAHDFEIVGEGTNGEEGIALYKELKPDLVTLDITMPVLDGVGALKEIMAFDPNAKAVMVTAAGQQGNVVESVKLGAAEFVTKPFDEDALIAVLNRVLGK